MPNTDAVNAALKRLRAALPHGGADTGPDPVEDILTLINAAVENHCHGTYGRHNWTRGGNALTDTAVEDDRAPRPGRAEPVPTAELVLDRVQVLLGQAGVQGYAPLSVDKGVDTLILRYKTAQAESRQWREAASHRRQIEEHYRDALSRIAAIAHPTIPIYEIAATALDHPPEWDRVLR